MIKCIIVDDEPMAIKVLESHLSQLSTVEIVATHQSPTAAFDTLQSNVIDLIFLDLQMPGMTGFSLLKTLPQYPHVIITTAHREFALESYDFTITDYLLKPISFPRLLKAIGKVTTATNGVEQNHDLIKSSVPQSDFFYIQSERQFYKIQYADILYIESIRNHIRIVTLDKKYTTLSAIGDIEHKLSELTFIRIHRSFIVSIDKIESFNHRSLEVGGTTLTIGKVYKNEFLKRMNGKII